MFVSNSTCLRDSLRHLTISTHSVLNYCHCQFLVSEPYSKQQHLLKLNQVSSLSLGDGHTSDMPAIHV
jgi:hypothetical protein